MKPMRMIPDILISRMKRATIMDVARACGVSATTVSKVMNVSPELIDVPEGTRKRVLEVSRQLGYQASWRARAFARGKTHVIGLLHRQTNPLLASHLWHRMVGTLASVAQDQSYDVQFVPLSRSSDRWRSMLLDQRLDGCIVAHELWPQVAETIRTANLPAVLLNALQDGFDSVVPDDAQGARLVTQHLIDLGHRAVALVDEVPGSKHFSLQERQKSFLATMTAAGLGDAAMILSGDSVSEMLGRIRGAKPAPTAVITYGDTTALPLLHACWEQGIRVPQDMSVATFNDVPFTRFSVPPLTTVDIPVEHLARRAMEILLERVRDSAKPAEPICEMLPEQLIVRRSTTAPGSADEKPNKS